MSLSTPDEVTKDLSASIQASEYTGMEFVKHEPGASFIVRCTETGNEFRVNAEQLCMATLTLITGVDNRNGAPLYDQVRCEGAAGHAFGAHSNNNDEYIWTEYRGVAIKDES